ncbi:MAG: hypothetical protein ACXWLI_12155, partial [Myxococcaceae bacterium]
MTERRPQRLPHPGQARIRHSGVRRCPGILRPGILRRAGVLGSAVGPSIGIARTRIIAAVGPAIGIARTRIIAAVESGAGVESCVRCSRG